MDGLDANVADWMQRVQAKVLAVNNNIDRGLLQAATYCEGQAKNLAMERIYNVDIPTDIKGKPKWKRTGLYKASIASGINPNSPHSAMIYNPVPYAWTLEVGNSRGIRGKYIMSDAVLKNNSEIIKIIRQYIANKG